MAYSVAKLAALKETAPVLLTDSPTAAADTPLAANWLTELSNSFFNSVAEKLPKSGPDWEALPLALEGGGAYLVSFAMVAMAAFKLVATACTELDMLLGDEETETTASPDPASAMVTPVMALPKLLVLLVRGMPFSVTDALLAVCANTSPVCAELGL